MSKPVKLLVPDTSNEFGAREPSVAEVVEWLRHQQSVAVYSRHDSTWFAPVPPVRYLIVDMKG